MNVLSLIERHPLLQADLRAHGLPHAKVVQVARQISTQLGGSDGNLCHVLDALTTSTFLHAINTRSIATATGISAPLAQAVILTVAPWIDRFELRSG